MDRLKPFSKWIALACWALLFSVACLLLYNSAALFDMFTGHAFSARFSARDLSPREILRTSSEAARACELQEIKPNSMPTQTRQQPSYDAIYNNLVRRDEVGLYQLEKGIIRHAIENSNMERCLREELSRRLALQDMTVDPEVLWIYIVFRKNGNDDLLAIWPKVKIKEGFRAEDRPWYPAKISKAGTNPVPYGSGYIWQTPLYNDVFTGESVVSMLYKPETKGNGKSDVYSGVDVRADPFPSTFHLIIFLNFLSLLIFSIINALATRQLDTEFAYSWYWAWLCWALLYSVYAVVYLLRVPLPVIDNVRFNLLGAVPILSIANNIFFALAGLQLLEIGTRKKRTIICLSGGAAVTAMYFLIKNFEEAGLLEAGSSRWVDAACSFLVTGLLGWAFISQLKAKGRVISSPEPFSVPVAQGLVGLFFFIFALHQLEIARSTSNPVVDQIFWMFSLLMKIGLAALYYIMILKFRYREEGEVGAIVFERMEQGVVAVDSNLSILAINGSAAELIGIRRVDVLGKDIREVAFRSLFETERLARDLTTQRIISSREILMKKYYDGYPGKFHDTLRLVSAQIVKDSELDRIFALIYLRPSGVAQATQHPNYNEAPPQTDEM